MRVIFAILLSAGVVLANASPPPRPPEGQKAIAVDVSVKLEKEIKGYVVFDDIYAVEAKRQVVGTEKAVTLPSHPWAVKGSQYPAIVYAVPEDLVPKLKDLSEAERAKILTHKFDGQHFADKSDERKLILRQFIIKSIDPKKGIEVEVVKDEKSPEKKEEKKLLAPSEPGYLIGGSAAALGITLGGLWLVRRRKADRT